MATKSHLTDPEAAEGTERLADELRRPDDILELERLKHSARTMEESMAKFIGLRKKAGRWLPDEDFAKDVEEGRRLLREPLKDLWD